MNPGVAIWFNGMRPCGADDSREFCIGFRRLWPLIAIAPKDVCVINYQPVLNILSIGERQHFAMTSNDLLVFQRLMDQIHQRAIELPDGSYTTKLIQGGPKKMGSKILEEAAEVVMAAVESTENEHLVYESCDLIYHLWVLLGSRGVNLDQLADELRRREGTSGLDEKAARTSP